MKKFKIAFLDDEKDTLDRYKRIIEENIRDQQLENVEVVGQFLSENELLQYLKEDKVIDLLVLDLQIRDDEEGGIKILSRLSRDHSSIKVAVISNFIDQNFLTFRRIVESGNIHGAIRKQDSRKFLKNLVDLIRDDSKFYQGRLFDWYMDATQHKDLEEDLDKETYKILELICKGYSSSEIKIKYDIEENDERKKMMTLDKIAKIKGKLRIFFGEEEFKNKSGDIQFLFEAIKVGDKRIIEYVEKTCDVKINLL